MLRSINSKNSLLLLAFGIGVGSILGYLGGMLNTVNVRKSADQKAFFLGVSVKFPTVQDKTAFMHEFRPLADYVRTEEPTTISYELLESDKDSTLIYILERYKTKKAYLEIHKHSKPFLNFRAKFQEMINNGTIVDGQSYIESNIGFV